MESRRKRRRSQLYKWGLYVLLLLACTVLQTIPGFLHIGQAKPVFLLPLALAGAMFLLSRWMRQGLALREDNDSII